MTAFGKFPDRKQMLRFLYAELPEDEAEALEDQFFTNKEFFYELTSLEHELVDQYVRGILKGEDLARFERSLLKSPARREQIKNARALQRHINERNSRLLENPTVSIWSQLQDLFGKPVLQFAMALLILVLGIASTWLFLDRQRLRREVAQQRNEQTQRELAQQKNVNDMKADLNNRQAEVEQLKRELESKRPSHYSSGLDYEAEINFKNTMGGGSLPKIIKRTERSVTVKLPEIESGFESYEIKVTSGPAISTTMNIITENGQKYLMVTLPAQSMVFSVMGIIKGRSPKTIAEYKLDISRR